MSDESQPKATQERHLQTRRALFKGMAFAPLAAATLSGCEPVAPKTSPTAATDSKQYSPSYFTAAEWAFLNAACDRLIPADQHGPGALELGVPEFIDRHMSSAYASGQLWYMQGPFVEAPPEFGYQGPLSVREIMRAGIYAVDKYCGENFHGKTFAQLDAAEQRTLLKNIEDGKVKLEGIAPKAFFSQLLSETRNGYFTDPGHGGNKNMGAWKMIGYPGVRADYLDWVEVRDRPYPLPPVEMSGRRG